MTQGIVEEHRGCAPCASSQPRGRSATVRITALVFAPALRPDAPMRTLRADIMFAGDRE